MSGAKVAPLTGRNSKMRIVGTLPMSKLDRMLLSLTTEHNPMLIFGMIVLDGTFDTEELRDTIGLIIEEQPRLRSYMHDHQYKVLSTDSFNVDDHFKKLDGPSKDETLETYVSGLCKCHFNPSEPPWDILYFEASQNQFKRSRHSIYSSNGISTGSSVGNNRRPPQSKGIDGDDDDAQTNTYLCFRLHHCIGDGMSMFYLLERFVELSKRSRAEKRKGVSETSKLIQLRRTPIPMHRLLLWPLWMMVAIPQVVCMWGDRSSFIRPALKNMSHITKVIAWCRPFPKHLILKIAASRGYDSATSVLLAITSGAIRMSMERRGERVDRDIKAIVPFSLRSSTQTNLENQASSLFVYLPISEQSRKRRLEKCCTQMYDLKTGPYALVAIILMTLAVWFLPDWLLRRLQQHYASKCSLIFSSVPGPDTVREFFDRPVLGVLGFPPSLGDVSLSIASFEYDGNIRIGMMMVDDRDKADKAEKDSPAKMLVSDFETEFDCLLDFAGDDATEGNAGEDREDDTPSKIAWA